MRIAIPAMLSVLMCLLAGAAQADDSAREEVYGIWATSGTMIEVGPAPDGGLSAVIIALKNLMVPSRTTETNMRVMGGLYANLFDAHPPFQIDGNFGATSGITEMLLQSHLRNEKGDYYLDILPALPSVLTAGSVKGIKGRGGFEVSISWDENKLASVEILSLIGNNLNLRYNNRLISKETVAGETYTYSENDFK